ncbi:PREDICTED: putative BTB/POZ domain-containing protein At2g05330 [Camelina sativa]|uniref:BTB/POZ domain-containing protein At2g05330 n=1 Tax=Camelina sativa TaxID=90675 RepID=A0ABM1QRM4_CAMSA|nr:PREDICTED: putative BTB/POZ domain-containing protein At2g05330 [Camelina sativa]
MGCEILKSVKYLFANIRTSNQEGEEIGVRLLEWYSDIYSGLGQESRSEVFKKLLNSDEFKTSSKQVETITLSEMKQEDLEAFVEFIYSDGSMLSEKVKRHARALYLAADKYKILQLRDLCRSELISSLDMANSLDFLELAQTPFDKVLNDAALNYIKTNDLMIPSVDKFESFIDSYQNLAVEILEASITRRRCYNCGFINDHNLTGKSCSNCGFDRPSRS